MYKIEEKSVKDLEQAFELLNQIETKGIQNHSIIANIASLLQKFRSEMVDEKEEIDNKIKISNLPIKKKEEEKNGG